MKKFLLILFILINAKVFSQVNEEGIKVNDEHFLKFKANNEFERKLLKSAKELRLCLKYWPLISPPHWSEVVVK